MNSTCDDSIVILEEIVPGKKSKLNPLITFSKKNFEPNLSSKSNTDTEKNLGRSNLSTDNTHLDLNPNSLDNSAPILNLGKKRKVTSTNSNKTIAIEVISLSDDDDDDDDDDNDSISEITVNEHVQSTTSKNILQDNCVRDIKKSKESNNNLVSSRFVSFQKYKQVKDKLKKRSKDKRKKSKKPEEIKKPINTESHSDAQKFRFKFHDSPLTTHTNLVVNPKPVVKNPPPILQVANASSAATHLPLPSHLQPLQGQLLQQNFMPICSSFPNNFNYQNDISYLPLDSIPLPDQNNCSNGEMARGTLRPIAIDGSNVAYSHGKNKYFSCKGIELCVKYFLNRGHTKVKAFVPQFRRTACSKDVVGVEILEKLGERGAQYVVFTPSRTVRNKLIYPYDDRFILEYASQTGAVVVSNDNYRDLLKENVTFRSTIEERLLMYTFADDVFMVPQDPMGKKGPSLDQFLVF